MPLRAPFQPPQRALEGVPGGRLVRSPGHDMVERHRDVRAERPLDLGRALRRQVPAAPVDVALELDAVLVHAARALEREHLKATRVGEERTVPPHEADRKSTRLNSSHVEISYAV